jgi:hypothetical protein
VSFLFVAAIVAALVALGVKRWRRSSSSRLEEDERARVITSHAEIRDYLRCACGGKRLVEGEGPKGDLWRVVTRCGSCDTRRALLFRVAS